MLTAKLTAVQSPSSSVIQPLQGPKPALPNATVPANSVSVSKDQLQVQTQRGKIPALAAAFQTLPPIEVEKRGNFTWYRNAFGVQITHVAYPEGNYYYLLSSRGQAVMLRQHNDKRDTLNFSDMNFNIAKPSQIPNVYFHVPGQGASTIHFDEQHRVVVDLGNGEQFVLNRENGETLESGPFKISFFPDEQGQNFNVDYSGSDPQVRRYRSKGDSIKW